MNFSEWIVAELDHRGWSRSEAARRGGISPSMFDKVINGYAKPGIRFIEGLAKAFGISKHEVLAKLDGTDINLLIQYETADMTADEVREVLEFVKMKKRLRKGN